MYRGRIIHDLNIRIPLGFSLGLGSLPFAANALSP
jgi:hypothetical protein